MSNNSNKILILADNRPGTYSQAISLAKELGDKFEILNISYSKLIKIPNFLFPNSPFRYDRQTRAKLKKITQFPKIIISPGRRSVTAALYIKSKSKNTSKIVQIMDPNLNPAKLDLVILPMHDKKKNHQNIINSIGAITSIDQNIVKEDKIKFSNIFEDNNKKVAVLLVGGPSKNTSFNKDTATKLANYSSQIANNIGAKLFILTSPRTTKDILEGLKVGLSCDFEIFDYNEVKNRNPYHAFLGYGDFFIITGDSVSMISECCSTDKPVFIFDDNEISSKKHKSFHQYLEQNNYAKDVNEALDIKNTSLMGVLNEAKRISLIIRKRFL